MQSLLPERAGAWTRMAAPQRFDPDDLWEYIDGGADQYLAYGFQEVVAAKYSNSGGATAAVDLYRMNEAVGAFGIYAQEWNPKATAVGLGVEGEAGTDSVRFWSGAYYVKITSTPAAASPQDANVALAAAIAGGLGAPGARPATVALFPTKGLSASSIRYLPANVLGQSTFSRGFEATYVTGTHRSTLVMVPFKSVDAARVGLTSYGTFLGRGGKPASMAPSLCEGGLSARDSFYGLVVAARSGSWLAVSLSAEDEGEARTLVRALCEGLARESSGQTGKAGH
jgi:hypothetical protein